MTVNTPRSADLSKLFSNPIALFTLGGLFALNAVSLDGPIVAVPAISEQFSVSKGQAQLITSIFLLGYAIAHIPIGLLGDRFGRRPVVLIGMGLTIILAFAACMAPTYESLISIRFLQGMTTASGGLLSRAIIRDVSEGRAAAQLTSKVLSILSALIILAPLLSGVVLEMLGWRYVLSLVFLYVSALTLLTVKYIPETFDTSDRSQTPQQQLVSSTRAFFSSRQAIFASFLGGMVFATYFIFATIGASVIEDVYAKPASLFGLFFAISAAMQLTAAQLNARLVRKWGVDRMLVIAMSLSLLGVTVSAVMWHFSVLPLFGFVMMGCLFSMSHGISLPNSIALTLDPMPHQAGFAASLNGMFQTGLTALVSLLVAQAYAGTLENTALLFVIFGCFNLIAFGLYRFYAH